MRLSFGKILDMIIINDYNMKKIIYLLSLMTVLILASCSDDLPKASWDICQVSSFNATAQDEKVLLEWICTYKARSW